MEEGGNYGEREEGWSGEVQEFGEAKDEWELES